MTTTSYGISGIVNPMMGLGNLGLGGVNAYSSYDANMPSTMGMGYGMGYGMMNPYSMGMMNPYGMGMMNPAFMAQMYGDMEKYQLGHAADMQRLTLDHEVAAQRNTNSALVKKILDNGSVEQAVQNLYTKVRERDMQGVCEEFDRLKKYIQNTYSDELKQYYKANPEAGIVEVIENMYASIVSKQENRVADLRSDIKAYGDDAFRNGFMSTFKKGHGDKYTEEALNHCFGMSINHKQHHDFTQQVGSVAGGAAHAIKMGAIGAGAGAAAFSLGNVVLSAVTSVLPDKTMVKDASGQLTKAPGFFAKLFKGKDAAKVTGEIVKKSRTVGFKFKTAGAVAVLAGVGAMLLDIVGQVTKAGNKEKATA